MRNYFDFLWAMTEKEIKARYKRAIFGFLWVILNPFLQMLIIGFVFSFFIKIPNYFLFLFSGLLPWQFFSLSLAKATPSIVHERALLQKAKFPIEAIPISIILSNFIHMLISIAIFLPIYLFFAEQNTLFLIFSILALVWLLLLTVGLSLLTASLNVPYRDVSFFVQTGLILLFYATPVLYNTTILPAYIRGFLRLNPLTSIFEILHIGFVQRGDIDTNLLVSNLAISLVIIYLGIIRFRRESKFFVDYL